MTMRDFIRELCKLAKNRDGAFAVDFEPSPDGLTLYFRKAP